MENKSGTFNIFIPIIVFILMILFFFVYKLHKDYESLKTSSITAEKKSDSNKQEIKNIEQKSDSWSEMQPKLKDCVVQVFNQAAQFDWLEPYKTPSQTGGSGSGFFINDKGHFITNAHVVNQAKAIAVQIPSLGKEQFYADIIAVCFERDLALLKLKDEDLDEIKLALGKIPYLELGDSQKITRANEVMVLGYPLGQQSLKSTNGIVSGTLGSSENTGGRYLIQIDAPLNPGNSGGPALDRDGKVIGIVCSGIMTAQNVGYIITVNELKNVLNDLYNAKDKLLRKPYLGIFFNAGNAALTKFLGNPLPGGCYITGVYSGSLLDKVGIKSGDMLYEIDGHQIDCFGEIALEGYEDKLSLIDYVSFIPLDQEVKMAVYRNGKRKDFKFNFTSSKLPEIRVMYPDFEEIDYEIIGGMVVMQLTRNHLAYLINIAPELIKYEESKNQIEPALIITHIHPDSQAQRSRILIPGARLKEVNGVAVKTLAEFRDAVRKSLEMEYLTVKTYSDIFTAFPFKRVLEDEFRLSKMYRYPITPMAQELMKEFVKKHEKTSGPTAAGTPAAVQ